MKEKTDCYVMSKDELKALNGCAFNVIVVERHI